MGTTTQFLLPRLEDVTGGQMQGCKCININFTLSSRQATVGKNSVLFGQRIKLVPLQYFSQGKGYSRAHCIKPIVRKKKIGPLPESQCGSLGIVPEIQTMTL